MNRRMAAATVAVTVGSLFEQPVLRDGQLENREHLCLTLSFDHDVVDGAPAARFMKRFCELLASGELVPVAAGAGVRPA
ncbi:MAG: 2-oxo acid dehydrogenase subunit E2 [Pseudomonadota bacterium]